MILAILTIITAGICIGIDLRFNQYKLFVFDTIIFIVGILSICFIRKFKGTKL